MTYAHPVAPEEVAVMGAPDSVPATRPEATVASSKPDPTKPQPTKPRPAVPAPRAAPTPAPSDLPPRSEAPASTPTPAGDTDPAGHDTPPSAQATDPPSSDPAPTSSSAPEPASPRDPARGELPDSGPAPAPASVDASAPDPEDTPVVPASSDTPSRFPAPSPAPVSFGIPRPSTGFFDDSTFGATPSVGREQDAALSGLTPSDHQTLGAALSGVPAPRSADDPHTIGKPLRLRPAAPDLPRQRDVEAVPDDISGALETLGDNHPAAAQLLCLCAVLHAAPVPVDVFTRSLSRLPRPLGGVAPLQFNGLVAALVEPGLILRGSQGLRLPEPVREAVREDLGDEASGVCRAYAGVLVAAAVPDEVAAPSSWPRWAALAPHLIASDAAHSADPALRKAACRLVVSLLHRGKARPARTIAAELHTGWRELLGPDHPDTLRCAHELARALIAAGALLPARKLLDDTVDRLVTRLGATHPQTRVAAETRRGVLLRMGGMPRPDTSRLKAAHRRRKNP